MMTADPKSYNAKIPAFVFLILSILWGCGGDEDFSYPVEPVHADVEQQLSQYASDLTAASHGWEGIFIPSDGKVFKMHVAFDGSNLQMLADVDTVSAIDVSQSVYSLISKDGRPVIQFSAGSHLDRMQTPDNIDGIDKEFTIMGKDATSIILQGNTFGDKMILHLSSPEFKENFRQGLFKQSIKGITSYLKTVRFLYLEPEPGTKIQFIIRTGLRSAYFTYVENERAQFFGSEYSYSAEGIQFRNATTIHGIAIGDFGFDNAVGKFYAMYNGSRIDAIESEIPLIPLHYLLGNEFESGMRLVAPWLIQQPGWSYKFKEAWALTDYDLDESEYGLGLLTIVADINPDNNTMKLIVQTIDLYGRSEFAEYLYKFSKDEQGIFSFEPLGPDTSTIRGQYAEELKEELFRILDIVDDYTYAVDFYEFNESFMAQYQSQEDIEMFFTGDFY